jgi:hypothetical protein
MERRLGDAPPRVLRRAYAWVDPDADPHNKTAYKFIHHEVAASGTVGAANVRGCTSGIGVLNGARGGAAIPPEHRKGVHAHLARHLHNAGEEPTPLK